MAISHSSLLSLDEARSCIAQRIVRLDPVRVPLASARGRILREEVCAPEDIPAFDRAAMDGYAVGIDDLSERFRVVGEIQAGASGTLRIVPGECVRIFTGAAIPEGASQVIMQEDTKRDGDFMIPTRWSRTTHVRARGEDARKGQVLLREGTRLGPAELALLAQLGAVEPMVSPVVRALHFTTGDELVDPGSQPGPGQIRDTNSTLIAALLAECGAGLTTQARCGDTLDALMRAVEECDASAWNLLLISGGASVGDYDFGARALERLGFQAHFRQINLRPGKPLIFATRDRQAAFVIPGNPLSHFVTFHTAIARALECFAGAPESWAFASVPLAQEIPEDPNPRETWWPCRVALHAGSLRADPLPWQSSGDLCGLASVNGLIRIPPRSEPLPSGSEVSCLLLGSHW